MRNLYSFCGQYRSCFLQVPKSFARVHAMGNDETRNGTQERNMEFFLEHSAHLAHATSRTNQQLEHKVLSWSSLGYGEMASSKIEETNPAVIDLTLQSASSASRWTSVF